jgi:hypothetical protein
MEDINMVTATDVSWALWLVPFVSAGGGAYLGSYLKKKGENLATHEDIDQLVDQVRAVTTATKQIEAKISDEVWNKQRLWELKRDGVYSVMQALGLADGAICELANGLRVQKKSDHAQAFDKVITARWLKAYERIEDFEKKRALALIVCGGQMTDTLLAVREELRTIAQELVEERLDAYERHGTTLKKLIAKAFAHAQKELGVPGATPQSNVSPQIQDRIP